MAQHDMNIANQGFPATRADLNNALQALASNNSGTSAPSTTFANQWWYDTTNNKLYIRNEANNAWIQVAVLDQTNAEWQITTGVIQAKDSDGLALKTDDGTTRLFIKDSDGDIGIQHSSPDENLHIKNASGSTIVKTEVAAGSAVGFEIKKTGATTQNWRIVDGQSANGKLEIYDVTDSRCVMAFDGSGNVGIGTASPLRQLSIANSASAEMSFISGTSSNASILFGDGLTGTDVYKGYIQFQHANDAMTFATSATERMRITAAGGIQIGTANGITSGDAAQWNMMNGSSGVFHRFLWANATMGSITINGSAVAYNTSSDYRLKTDAQPMTGASARVQALNPVNFEWIADGTRVDGFLAHEAATVVPEAVTGTKDAMRDEEYEVTPAVYEDVVIPAVLDEEGNELEAERTEQQLVTEAVMGTRSVPDYQGIDQAKLVPLLTAALQEAIAKIETLETKVAALEG